MNAALPDDFLICFDLDGEPVPLPRQMVGYLPVVHGILLSAADVLLQKHALTNRWQPLTTDLEPGQGLEIALHYRLRILLEIPIRIGPLLFAETHFVTENREKGWQLTRHYFLLIPAQKDWSRASHDPTADITLAWHNLATLTRADMQFGYDAIQLAQQLTDHPGHTL